ncbi:Folliculin-interacting protein 1 [Actinomortierella wolfii]|nr:Folliculin-interacting protein 1 [Actinomortierella wolfii]
MWRYNNFKPALTQAARSKSYSIAVIIDIKDNMQLREFIFSHFALIEARLHQLQALCMEILLPICRNALYSSHHRIQALHGHYFLRETVDRIVCISSFVLQNNPQGSYDPLWAQLSDLYGNIGTVSSVSRTIVVGTQASFVRRLLYILSYFIRCNEVFQRVIELDDDPESLVKPRPPPRASTEIREEEETGSPASVMRSISIPKRPSRIDTMPMRGSMSSSRMTNLDVPTTPIQQQSRGSFVDRSSGFGGGGGTGNTTTSDRPTAIRRPLIDTQRPRIETRDGTSPNSTPQHSGPTTPTTIESRGESDRISTGEDSTGGHAGIGSTSVRPLLAVDTRYGRSQSTETLDSQYSGKRSVTSIAGGTGGTESAYSDTPDSFFHVPMSTIRVVQTFPPFPNTATTTTSNGEEAKINGHDDGVTVSSTSQSDQSASSSQNQRQQHQSQHQTQSVPQAVAASASPASLSADTLFCKSYGRSLMATYCDHYLPDFALMGVPRCDFLDPMEADMKDMMRHFEIQERITSTVCIVADANTWKCNVFSAKAQLSEYDRPEIVNMQNCSTSAFVDTTLQRVVELFSEGLPAESCLAYLEDRLGQLYQYSKLLADMANNKELAESLFPNLDSVASSIGVQRSDLPLLASICATYDDSILAFDIV